MECLCAHGHLRWTAGPGVLILRVCVQAQGNNPQGAPLSNVVDVTLEVDAGTPGNAAAVRNQLTALVSGKTYLDVSSLCQLIATHSASQMMCMTTTIDAVL
jgi:hypothetical protein